MKNSYCLIFIGITIFNLISCSKNSDLVNSSNPLQVYEENNFEISFPLEAKYKFERPDNSIAYSTNSGSSFYNQENDYLISIYKKTNAACETKLHGITEIQFPVLLENSVWGKSDYLSEAHVHDDEFNEWSPTVVCGSAYAFCSSKNQQTVVICINQMTDDQELAKEIFKTFKWKQ